MEWIIIIAIVVVIIVISVMINQIARGKRITCPECKKKYDYEDDISWIITGTTSGPKSVVAHAEITCTCAECGKTKKIRKNFTTVSIDNEGRQRDYNIEDLIEKYMS